MHANNASMQKGRETKQIEIKEIEGFNQMKKRKGIHPLFYP